MKFYDVMWTVAGSEEEIHHERVEAISELWTLTEARLRQGHYGVIIDHLIEPVV